MEHVLVLLVDVYRLAVAEGIEELDLSARPCGFLAAIFIRKQIDVVAIGVGSLRELMRALVNVRPGRGCSAAAG
jgi:hypothetical protein